MKKYCIQCGQFKIGVCNCSNTWPSYVNHQTIQQNIHNRLVNYYYGFSLISKQVKYDSLNKELIGPNLGRWYSNKILGIYFREPSLIVIGFVDGSNDHIYVRVISTCDSKNLILEQSSVNFMNGIKWI